MTDAVDFERYIAMRSISGSARYHVSNSKNSLQIPGKPDGRVDAKAELPKDLVPGHKDLTDEDGIPVS